ncbi:IS1-like element transposase [Xenorhabdus bovienii]
MFQYTFQFSYLYNSYRPDTKEKIIDIAMNGSNVRDTKRVLRRNI